MPGSRSGGRRWPQIAACLLSVITVLLPTTGSAQPPRHAVTTHRVGGFRVAAQEAEDLAQQASDAAGRGDWAGARDLLRRAQRLAPLRAGLLVDLGVALENTGAPREALAAYRQAVEMQPDYVAAVQHLAALLAGQGDMDGAVYVLSAALERMPEEASLHYHLALVLFHREQGMVAPAVEALRRAHDLGYSAPQMYLLLGRVERLDGNASAAIDLLRQGLDLAPRDVELLHEMGLSLTAAGDLEAATSVLTRAARSEPGDASIAADLAKLYLQAQRPNDALAMLQEFDDGQNADIVYLLGQAQRALGEPEAADTLRRYLAIQAAARASRESATRAMVEVTAGVASWDDGDLPASVDHFERAMQERPGWSPARAYLAAALLELGEVRKAVVIAEDLLDSDPRNPQALMVLGQARMSSSPAQGLALLQEAVDLYPFRPVCLLTLGEAYAQLGRDSDARALVDRAAEVEPDSPWVSALRERLRSRRRP